MRIIQAILLIIIICTLGGTGFLVNKLLQLTPFLSGQEEHVACSVIIWNKSPQDIDIIVRPQRARSQHVEAASSTRACLAIQSKAQNPERAQSLKYIAVVYAGKKYKFNDRNLLNQFFEQGSSTRYFALMTIDASDVQWSDFKERVSNEKMKIDENSKYIILSNYPKLSTPWDTQARLQTFKLKVPRIPKIRRNTKVEKVEAEA